MKWAGRVRTRDLPVLCFHEFALRQLQKKGKSDTIDTVFGKGCITMNETKKAVVSVLGSDRKGIIANVSRVLYEHDVNILDITQTITSGLFNMLLIADVTDCDFDSVKRSLEEVGETLDVQIRIQRDEIFDAMHRI